MDNGKRVCRSCWCKLTANAGGICIECIRAGRGPTPQPGKFPTAAPPSKRTRREAGEAITEQLPAAVRFGRGV